MSWGVESPTFRGSQFLEEGCWKRGGEFFEQGEGGITVFT